KPGPMTLQESARPRSSGGPMTLKLRRAMTLQESGLKWPHESANRHATERLDETRAIRTCSGCGAVPKTDLPLTGPRLRGSWGHCLSKRPEVSQIRSRGRRKSLSGGIVALEGANDDRCVRSAFGAGSARQADGEIASEPGAGLRTGRATS